MTMSPAPRRWPGSDRGRSLRVEGLLSPTTRHHAGWPTPPRGFPFAPRRRVKQKLANHDPSATLEQPAFSPADLRIHSIIGSRAASTRLAARTGCGLVVEQMRGQAREQVSVAAGPPEGAPQEIIDLVDEGACAVAMRMARAAGPSCRSDPYQEEQCAT